MALADFYGNTISGTQCGEQISDAWTKSQKEGEELFLLVAEMLALDKSGSLACIFNEVNSENEIVQDRTEKGEDPAQVRTCDKCIEPALTEYRYTKPLVRSTT